MTTGGFFGPFKPGFGGMPPHLAGRQEEQDLFRGLLADLENGEPLASDIVLYGPHGNGKTVLLRWLEDEVGARDGIETVVLLPSDVPDRRRLAELLAPKSWWDRLTPQQVEVAEVAWRPGAADGPPPLVDILTARARKTPLLVVMDEAHTLDLEVGRALLNAGQRTRGRYPFLLVLAGTPNLEAHLNAMGASFWSRAWTRRIGRLDEAGTEEALQRPFEAAGMHVDDGALAEMVRLSHGYPFFIQLLGREAWAQAAPPLGSGAVTVEAFERARPRFEHRKSAYYRRRYRELEDSDLLPAGRAVAEAFARRQVLDTASLRHAIAATVPDRNPPEVTRVQHALADLSFIWGTSPDPDWEPGIPSLPDHVRKHAPAAL